MSLRTILTIAVLSFPVSAAAAAAPEWYVFENEDGVTVMSHYIPPSLVHKGYRVVDASGKTLRVVPRELTGAELAAKKAREAEEERRAEEQQTRQRKDEELFKLYASVADVEAARDRKLASIEADIGRIRTNVERAGFEKARNEALAAERERGGQTPSAELIQNIQRLEQQIRGYEGEIQSRRSEIERERRNFEYDIERMRVLLGEAPAQAASDQSTGVNTAAASSGH